MFWASRRLPLAMERNPSPFLAAGTNFGFQGAIKNAARGAVAEAPFAPKELTTG